MDAYSIIVYSLISCSMSFVWMIFNTSTCCLSVSPTPFSFSVTLYLSGLVCLSLSLTHSVTVCLSVSVSLTRPTFNTSVLNEHVILF